MAIRPEPLLTGTEVARLLGVTDRTVRRLVATGQLQAVRTSRRTTRFRPSDIEVWLDAHSTDDQRAGLDDDFAAALSWLQARDANRTTPLCPRCARYPQQPSGLCTGCMAETRQQSEDAHQRELERKRNWWNANGQHWREERRRQAAIEALGIDQLADHQQAAAYWDDNTDPDLEEADDA